MPCPSAHFSLRGTERTFIPRDRIMRARGAGEHAGGIGIGDSRGGIDWRICVAMLCEERIAAGGHGQTTGSRLALPEPM